MYAMAQWESGSQEILWTIDDGPNKQSTYEWMNLLERKNKKAIFFVSTNKAVKHPEIVEEIRNRGHTIGSHGHDHLDGWKTNTKAYVRDALKSAEILNTELFRPPYGRMTRNQYNKLKTHFNIMMWSLMPGDFDKSANAEKLASRITLAQAGDILVFHDNPEALKKVESALDSYIYR